MVKTERICDICGEPVDNPRGYYTFKNTWCQYLFALCQSVEYISNMDVCHNCMSEFKEYIAIKRKDK